MGIEKFDAIVMRSYPLRDTSRIVHLLTLERGHLKAVAKGARAPRGRFGAALEPFTRIHAVVYYRPDRDLQLLSQVDILRARRVLGRSVVRYAYASAVIELLAQLLGGEEAQPDLFELVDSSLERLASMSDERLRAVFTAFVVQILDSQGLRPELRSCVACRGDLGRGMAFEATRGGVVCRRCAGTAVGLQPLSEDARRTLMLLLDGQIPERLAGGLADQVARALDAFLRAHVPRYRRLRSLDLVRATATRA